jgi:hypothetical protein
MARHLSHLPAMSANANGLGGAPIFRQFQASQPDSHLLSPPLANWLAAVAELVDAQR